MTALARDGYDVALTYVSSAPDSAPDRGAARIAGYQVDIRDASAVSAAFATIINDFGCKPSLVFCNAGINVPPSPLATFDAENFRKLVETNIVGAFNILQEASRNTADGGSIIATTTSLVRHAAPGLGPYSASKAAVECLLRSLAREVAGRNIRVNGVAPGPVDTDLFRSGKDEAAVQRSAAMSPFNRVGRPEEIAEVVSFLASDKATWISGQIVQPNGGLI